jgi:hypothetical protein
MLTVKVPVVGREDYSGLTAFPLLLKRVQDLAVLRPLPSPGSAAPDHLITDRSSLPKTSTNSFAVRE